MFITLEGPEGGGKSTLARGLADHFRSEGQQVTVTREPGAEALGVQIRKLLLEGEDMPILSELFLFLADRANNGEKVIRPALERGEIVICDRYIDSTVVYQGYARGLDLGMLRQLNRLATRGLIPDQTFLLDLDVAVGLSRIKDKDRLDQMDREFHQKVREGFLAESELQKRWIVLDATLSPEQILAQAIKSL